MANNNQSNNPIPNKTCFFLVPFKRKTFYLPSCSCLFTADQCVISHEALVADRVSMGTSCSSSKTTGQSPLTHLSSRQLEELHQLTHLPVGEIVAHHRQFLQTSPDGRLTYEQFEHQLPTKSKSRAVFNMIDRDRSGEVTFEEYLLSVVMFSEQSQPEQQLAAVFETYQALARSHLKEPSTDTHNRGMNRADVEQLLQRIHGNLSRDELQELTDRYMTTDENRDGYISKQEFISACMKNAQLMEQLGHKEATLNETKNWSRFLLRDHNHRNDNRNYHQNDHCYQSADDLLTTSSRLNTDRSVSFSFEIEGRQTCKLTALANIWLPTWTWVSVWTTLASTWSVNEQKRSI